MHCVILDDFAKPTNMVKTLKVRVKVKISLEQAMKTQRGSRGIALVFL
jgi:hypothetical protein